MRFRDLAFYAIPGAIMVVAGVMAWRYWNDRRAPSSEPEPLQLVTACPPNRYRCQHGEVLVSTGDEATVAGKTECVTRSIARCRAECVVEGVNVDGIDDATAARQLCDRPQNVEPLVASEATATDLGEDGGVCESDGWGPSDDGVLECILRSVVDPNALGLVVHRVRCATGVVVTGEKLPRLMGREQAIALYCRRDDKALANIDAAMLSSETSVDAPSNAPTDAPHDATFDAPHDGPLVDATIDADARK